MANLPFQLPGNLTVSGNYSYIPNVFLTISSSLSASSTDGITWITSTVPSLQNWQALTYGNGTFVAIPNALGTTAATSIDGITWTIRTLPSSVSWFSVTYGNKFFLAVASGTTTDRKSVV